MTGSFFPSAQDELPAERPVVLPVGIEFDADGGNRAGFTVLDDDLRRLASGRHQRKRIPPPFGILGHRRDEEFAVDERLQGSHIRVERANGFFECIDTIFQAVEPLPNLRIVVLAAGQCHTQQSRPQKQFFHKIDFKLPNRIVCTICLA